MFPHSKPPDGEHGVTRPTLSGVSASPDTGPAPRSLTRPSPSAPNPRDLSRKCFRCRLALACLIFAFLFPATSGAAEKIAGDLWLTNHYDYPSFTGTNVVRSEIFGALHAEALAGKLKISWPSKTAPVGLTLVASADDPGHWPARDWRSSPMQPHGESWEAFVPVDSLDVPVIYFVRAGTNISPMRLARPRALGLEEPTRIFWPFLEGFEEGLESWRLLTPGAAELKTGTPVKNGKAALVAAVPAGKKSVAVATTRVRGWFAEEHGARGLSVWLRAREGTGHARFTLMAQAFTTNQVVAVRAGDVPLTAQWQRVELPFSSFPKIPRLGLDLFTIEFIADGPREFLVDDLQLLGRWPVD